MYHLIAACGLDCSKCEAYIATQANDEPAKQTILERWVKQYGPMSIDNVSCDGCMVNGSRHGGYCSACPVRACSQDRGLPGCFKCPDYPCEKITTLMGDEPAVKARMERLRSG